VKIERLQILQRCCPRSRTKFNAACAGRVMPVLFEKPGRKPDQAVGRSPICSRFMSKAPGA
jgi:tRNA-2-methylthio-N6-dimethylallyladenosine synthase